LVAHSSRSPHGLPRHEDQAGRPALPLPRDPLGCGRRLSDASIYCLVFERDRDHHAIVRTQVPGDVTFPGRIFDQVDVPWTDGDLLAARDLDLRAAAERDDVLAPPTAAPAAGWARRAAAAVP